LAANYANYAKTFSEIRVIGGWFPLLSSLYFFDSGSFATKFTDVIELCTPDASGADNFDFVDDLRVHWKDAFNAMSERNFANSEGLSDATVFEADANAFENLNALFIAFFDLHVNFDGIARFE